MLAETRQSAPDRLATRTYGRAWPTLGEAPPVTLERLVALHALQHPEEWGAVRASPPAYQRQPFDHPWSADGVAGRDEFARNLPGA